MDDRRRRLLTAAAGGAASGMFLSKGAEAQPLAVTGSEHWAVKTTADGAKVRLFLWRKRTLNSPKGALLFAHGSAVPATALFDLQVAGRPEASTMDWFARLGYDTWCVDGEGYGRSEKDRSLDASASNGAEDLAAASEQVMRVTGQRPLLYGVGAGALRAGLFAQQYPDRLRRLVLDTSAGLTDKAHPETIDAEVSEAFARTAFSVDPSASPNWTGEMDLAVLDPARIAAPTLLLRGALAGQPATEDLAGFFARLANADKQLAILPGIGQTSTLSKNWALVYHLLDGFFSQPPPAFPG